MKRVELLSFSARGEALGGKLAAALEGLGWQARAVRCPKGGLDAWTRENFGAEALIFLGSCGIAVRAVAPYVTSKLADPAVVVVDETGTFAVSLLSGHLGGANRLAETVAGLIGAAPVITTATDRRGLFAVDTWAKAQGLTIAEPHRIKEISGRLLAGETVTLSGDQPIGGLWPPELAPTDRDGDIVLSWRSPEGEGLHLIPPVLTLGVGCRKGTPFEALAAAVTDFLRASGCHPAAVRQVCTIDLKAREPGLLAFCRDRDLPLVTYPAEALAAVPGAFTPSAFVREVTGVDNVCERSARLGSGPNGTLLRGKTKYPGITLALAWEPGTVCF